MIYSYLKITNISLCHFSFYCNLSKTDRQTNNTICIGFGTPDKPNVDRLQLKSDTY